MDSYPHIDARKLNEKLGSLGFDVKVVASTGSTNDDLKKEAGRLPHYSVLIAEEQTHGRGRQDRSFQSQSGKGIFTSLLMKCTMPADQLGRLSIDVACAVAETLQATCDASVMIKWPNDILIDGLKVSGILIESLIDPKTQNTPVVIGIGINVHAQTFPDELKGIAGWLDSHSKHVLDRDDILVRLYRSLHKHLHADFKENLGVYRHYLFPKGTPLKVIRWGQTFMASFSHLDEEGALWVQDEHGGNHRLISEEVSIRL